MMDINDPLSQLALCCGLRNKKDRKLMKMREKYFANPFAFGPTSADQWVMAAQGHPFGLAAGSQLQPFGPTNPQQPYILLSQPVIIATSPVPNQLNTMTLVQHHSQAGGQASCLQIAQHQQPPGHLQQLQLQQPAQERQHQSLMSSQYGIYSIVEPTQQQQRYQADMYMPSASNNMINALAVEAPHSHHTPKPEAMAPISFAHKALMSSTYNMMSEGSNQQQQQYQQQHPHQLINYQNQRQLKSSTGQTMMATIYEPPSVAKIPLTPVASRHPTSSGLRQEVFRQLVQIEKQVNIDREMEEIERSGAVLTRPIDPDSLRPQLNDSMLAKYHSFVGPDEDYLIRFIEVIKRPGQTLGLYIRSVQFDHRFKSPLGPGVTISSRVGLIITKIDSNSPVYNSPVLRIGDEILSVNLVDIQGMSLDDIVIIMSLPKRLVLALKVPSDRDEILRSSQPDTRSNSSGNRFPPMTYSVDDNNMPIVRPIGPIGPTSSNSVMGTPSRQQLSLGNRENPNPRPVSSLQTNPRNTLVNPYILDNPSLEMSSRTNSNFQGYVRSSPPASSGATNAGNMRSTGIVSDSLISENNPESNNMNFKLHQIPKQNLQSLSLMSPFQPDGSKDDQDRDNIARQDDDDDDEDAHDDDGGIMGRDRVGRAIGPGDNFGDDRAGHIRAEDEEDKDDDDVVGDDAVLSSLHRLEQATAPRSTSQLARRSNYDSGRPTSGVARFNVES